MEEQKLKEILTDMMATSPSRDWFYESKCSPEEMEEKRNENLDHIENYTKEILDFFNLTK